MSDIETTFTDVPGSGERHLRPRKLTEKAYQIYEDKVSQNLSELRDLRKDIESDLSSIQNSLSIPDITACTATKNDLLPKLTAYTKISDNFISYLKRIHIEESKLELNNHSTINDVFYQKIDSILNQIDEYPKSNGIEDKTSTLLVEAEINFENQQSTPIPKIPRVLSQQPTQRRSSGSVQMSSTPRSAKGHNTASILLQQNAKLDAAKTRLKYAEKQAELKRQKAEIDRQQAEIDRKKAEIETDMDLLQRQSEVEEAEVELSVMDSQLDQHSDHISSVSERHTTAVDKAREGRTRSYIEDQNSRIKPPATKTYSHYSNPCFLSPEAPNFTPKYPQVMGDRNTNISTELTKFLLKKDLLLSRFTNFDDQPETFSIWKSTFLNIVRELDVTPSEELDLLVKWLGPESSKHAVSLRQSNATNPARGLERIWKRLDERYGGAERVEANLKKRLTDFPKVTTRDYKKLYELSDILTEIESVKEDPNYAQLLSYYDTSLGINPVVSKLPYHLQNKWFDRAAKYKRSHQVIFPPFTFFVNYINEMSIFLNDPGFIIEQPKPVREDPRSSSNSNNTGFQHKRFNKTPVATKKTEVAANSTQDGNTSSGRTIICLLHKTAHSLNDCRTFRAKSYEERQQFLKDNRVCYKCCDSNDHNFRTCTMAVKCSDCGSTQHPTALHKSKPDYKPAYKTSSTTIPHGGEQPETNRVETSISSKCTTVCGNPFGGKSCAKTVLADIFPTGQFHKAVRTYVIIDEQSNRTLAKPKLLDLLDVSTEPVPYTLTSCSGNITTSGRHANGLSIQSIDGTTTMELPTIIECRDIPNDRSEISTPDIAKQYEHLKNISDKIPALDSNADILLLVGRDLIEAHHVQEQIVGPRNSPFAQRLNLGWVIVGEVCLNQTHRPTLINVNKTHTLPNGRNTIQEPCQNSLQLKEHQLQEFLNSKLTPQDHIGESVFIRTKNDEKIGTSREDKQFIQIMDTEFHQNTKGNWTAPLPFKTPKPNLLNNRSLALHRANLLDTSLKKNPVKRQHFVTFMEKVLNSGAAEEAPPLIQKDCWYLPIFGVYHPKKPDQIRGVFDSSALYEGTSLNNVLLTGPDLINNLLGVLLRFRKDEYAVTADIEQMFYSFFVRDDHRDYLRFFWYQDNNPDKYLVEYRMRVHVFGNSPSPAVATYGLRRAVENADSDIKNFVNNNFYVDDALTSLPTTQQAVNLIQRTQKVLKENGNIRLHKIASNSETILNAFKPEDLSKDLKSLELGQDVLPTQRSLGLAWNLQLDTFTFNIELEDKPYTRRGVLSIVNSLFDLMGFIAPVIIHGKHLLRNDSPWN